MLILNLFLIIYYFYVDLYEYLLFIVNLNIYLFVVVRVGYDCIILVCFSL